MALPQGIPMPISLLELANVNTSLPKYPLKNKRENIEQANDKVNQACKKILCNEIMESYSFDITKI